MWRRLPWLTLLTGAVAVLIFLSAEVGASVLQWDREAFLGGAWWQALSAHWVHWNFEHLLWDLAMFGIVGSLVEIRSRKAWLRVIVVSVLAISGAVLAFRPDLRFYRGLSGLDMALAAYWIFISFRESRRKGLNEQWLWGLGLVLLFSKALFETALGKAIFVGDLGLGIQNVAMAHLVGAFVGVATAFAWKGPK